MQVWKITQQHYNELSKIDKNIYYEIVESETDETQGPIDILGDNKNYYFINTSNIIIPKDKLSEIPNEDNNCVEVIVNGLTSNITPTTTETITKIDKYQKCYYNSREWLNNIGKPSTGSIVCYHGIEFYQNDSYEDMFLEISDCRNKIRLHKTRFEEKYHFIDKLKKLSSELNKFIDHLEKSPDL